MSVSVLGPLRAAYSVPFVGTVPAIKPACAASKTKRVSVLGTRATVQREYTQALIRNHAQACTVTLVGAARLASLAEDALSGKPVSDADILSEDRPMFRSGGQWRRPAHRCRRAGLHALPAVARSAAQARTMAGVMDRSGARDRPPRRRPAEITRAERHRRPRIPARNDIHLGPPRRADRARSRRSSAAASQPDSRISSANCQNLAVYIGDRVQPLARRHLRNQRAAAHVRSSCSICGTTFTNFGKSWALANLRF